MRADPRASARPVARTVGLDLLRGVAVVLMVLDHALAVAGQGTWARLTVTRLSLPLFMLVSGALLVGRRTVPWRRLCQCWAASFAAIFLFASMGLAGADILGAYAIAVPLLIGAQRHGLAAPAAALGATAAYTFPSWPLGYHPGYVLGLLGLGLAWGAAGRPGLDRVPVRGRLSSALAWVGRHPLWFYVAHLVALRALYTAGRG